MSERQIVLDTETTGIDVKEHRIIEIGCVELINRESTGRTFHHYLQPDRKVDEGAFKVHGISDEMLADKPRFKDIVGELIEFVAGAELVIHNAPFDVGHINAELNRLQSPPLTAIESVCSVLDTLTFARKKHPGQRNSLDALCKRYAIDNSQRTLHGALLDADILASVYLAMTGGQTELNFGGFDTNTSDRSEMQKTTFDFKGLNLPVIQSSDEANQAHKAFLQRLEKTADRVIWSD